MLRARSKNHGQGMKAGPDWQGENLTGDIFPGRRIVRKNRGSLTVDPLRPGPGRRHGDGGTELEGLPAALVLCSMMHFCRTRFGLVLTALVLAGCATAPPAAEGPDPWRSLAANMTADQVRASLGTPAQIRPLQTSQGAAEVWIYRRTVSVEVGLAPTSTEEVPYYDPFIKSERTVMNQVYSQESRAVTEELQLLMYDGKLVSSKRGYRTERSYQ
jgi:hypothetical protein